MDDELGLCPITREECLGYDCHCSKGNSTCPFEIDFENRLKQIEDKLDKLLKKPRI